MSDCDLTKLAGTLKNNKIINSEYKGGHSSSNVGISALTSDDKKLNTMEKMTVCFIDYRKNDHVELIVWDLTGTGIKTLLPSGMKDINP